MWDTFNKAYASSFKWIFFPSKIQKNTTKTEVNSFKAMIEGNINQRLNASSELE